MARKKIIIFILMKVYVTVARRFQDKMNNYMCGSGTIYIIMKIPK